jgi:hypothetical protein
VGIVVFKEPATLLENVLLTMTLITSIVLLG